MRMCVLLLVFLPLLSRAVEIHCESQSLNILLTNDDGYDQPGITALHRALQADGHSVKRIAPYRNYSGSSTSVTYDTDTARKRPDEEFEEIYAVGGSPATTVILGATAIFGADEAVDLVVSGINNGLNMGPASTASGTVGAVIAGMILLRPPVPGIAISTGRRDEDVTPEQNQSHVAHVADFVTRLIRTSQCSENSFIANGQSLNVNYPRMVPAKIRGVNLARQGRAHYFDLSFAATAEEGYEFDFSEVKPIKDIDDSDVILIYRGFITIVPIDGDYSAEPAFDADALLSIEP